MSEDKKKEIQEAQRAAVRYKTYKKSNNLINAAGSGTLLSQKLFAIGLQHVNIDKNGAVVCKVYGTELRQIFGSTSGSLYSHIEEACDRSVNPTGKTLFDWQYILKDPESKSLKASQIVTDCSFENGVLEIRYNTNLTDQIVNLTSNYTTFSLELAVKLKTYAAFRMYEMLKARYDHESAITKDYEEHIFEYHLTELKLDLGIIIANNNKAVLKELDKAYPDFDYIDSMINDADKKKYEEYSEFRRNILVKATNEINQKTDIHVTFEPMKKGKKVWGIRFTVNKNKDALKVKTKLLTQNTKSIPQKNIDETFVYDQISEIIDEKLKFSDIKAIAEAAEYDVIRISKAYDLAKKQKSITNLTGWIISALKNNYEEVSVTNNQSKVDDLAHTGSDYLKSQGFDNFEDLEKTLLNQ